MAIDSPDRSGVGFLDTVLRENNEQRVRQPQQEIGTGHAHNGWGLTGPFDMLGFIGEITSELGQKQMDLTNGISDFIGPTTSPAMDNDTNGTASKQQTPGISPPIQIPSEKGPETAELSREAQATYEEQLLVGIEAPPTIFGPVNVEWKYVWPALLTRSLDFNPLVNAIYCYADVHKAMMEGKRWKLAPTYYRQASSEIQECILGDVEEATLKKVFSAVFLLMLSELLSTSELCCPATSFLHSAYLLLQRFRGQTKSWGGLGYLMVSWVSLLDVKALIAGRDGDPLIELGQLSGASTGCGSGSTATKEPDDRSLAKPGYLIYEAITGPVFRFFVQSTQVIRRIVCIDLHHRSRGTLSDEFEVLQIAHKVGADLETLWNHRPRVLDIYDRPEELFDKLNPHIAIEVCQTFKQYVANFLASFIYLHRVAFAIYPRTDRVHGAVDKIIQLAGSSQQQQQQQQQDHQEQGLLPMSFVWPLFVAGLEGSLEQRRWIIQEMQRMVEDARAPQLRHPNAAQALTLLEEMTRRQDESRTGADSRCVRRELFVNSFVMI